MNPENVYFFTGFRTMLYTRFTAAYIPLGGTDPPTLFVATIDRPLVEGKIWSPPWTERIVYHGPDPDAAPTPGSALTPHLVGIEALGVDALRLTDAELIEQAAPGIRLVNVTAEINMVRQVKDPQELAHLRTANALAMQGIHLARRLMGAGPTTEVEVATALEADARAHGADGFGYPTLVSCGSKMLAVHSPALPLPNSAHQPVRIAFGPTVEWYTADVVRTVCIGAPPRALTHLQDGYLAARDALLRSIRPGASASDLLAIVRTEYERRSLLQYWRNNIGHGVGLTIHEPPRLAGAAEDEIVPGMVMAIEPSLSVPGFGGYAHCDVVHVTETGCEILTPELQGIVRV